MNIYEFKKNIPVIIKENNKEGYALYVKDSGFMQNDEWAIVLCESGEIVHCLTNQFVIQSNFTFNINKKDGNRNKTNGRSYRKRTVPQRTQGRWRNTKVRRFPL